MREESETVSRLREFIERGQEQLKGMVNFDLVESWNNIDTDDCDDETAICLKKYGKRVVASFSCLFVASLLDTILQGTGQLLSTNSTQCVMNGFSSDIKSTEKFVNEVNEKFQKYSKLSSLMVLQMHTTCMRMITLRVIDTKSVITEVRSLSVHF